MTRIRTPEEQKNTRFFQMEIKAYERVEGGVKIKGYASTPDIDRGWDIILPTAFQASLQAYLAEGGAPALLRSHNADDVVGSIIMEGEDAPVISEKGLYITALVTEKRTVEQIIAGEIGAFSVGYIPDWNSIDFEMRPTGKIEPVSGQQLFMEVRIIKQVDWVETSIVSTPANRKALFTLQKSVRELFSSFPSPTMKHLCDFCPEEKEANASGMIGEKFVCKSCVESMEFKGEKPEVKAIEEEKKEDKSEEGEDKPAAKAPEKTDEKPSGSESEEDKDKGSNATATDDGTKSVVFTETHLKMIQGIGEFLTGKSLTSEEGEDDKKEDKSVKLTEDEEKAAQSLSSLDVILPVMLKMAEEISNQRHDMGIMAKALKRVPMQKGKTFASMQFKSIQALDEQKMNDALDEVEPEKKNAKKESKFIDFILASKNAPDTVTAFDSGEDDDDDDDTDA